jgi:tetratricopeptide (TPR) repeat protein
MNTIISPLRTSILLLVFVVLGLYYPTIFAPMSSIDDPGMYSHLMNTDDFSFHNIFTSGGGNYYRPILIVSYMMDKYVWGLEVSFMHLENIVFHLLNTLLVFAIARKASVLQGIQSGIVPFIAALFFAIHPLNTEVVAWISGRTDLLAGFFLFLSVWLLLCQSTNYMIPVLAALCMLLACLAKETAIFFLPAAIMFPFYIPNSFDQSTSFRNAVRNNFPYILVFLAAGAGYFAFRTGAFSRSDAGVTQVFKHVGGEKSAGFLKNIYLILKAAGFYLKKLFVPFPLNFGITHVSDLYILLGIMLFVFVLWILTQRTLISYFFVCAAAIGSSALMIPLLKQTWTPLAERYMYIPSAFFIIALTFSICQWEKRKQYQIILTGVIILVAGIAMYGTSKRAILWQDNLAFFQDTLRKSPDFVPAQNEIANALYASGKMKDAGRVINSIKLPDDLINRQYGLISKASVLINNENYSGARILLKQALIDPGKHEVLILEKLLNIDKLELLANKTTSNVNYPDSVKNLSRLIELTSDPFYSYRLGIVYMQVGEKEKALAAFSTVVRAASPTAYYRTPAEKLMRDLGK